jgi:Rps23 Pro-64 3,4-dihydroxylase Tpa1-like proline 4-hydroxylase
MQYVWWRDFLDTSMIEQVREVATINQHKFVPTSVSTNVANYRRSTVLWHYHFVPLYEAFVARLRSYLPLVTTTLGMSFDIGNIEVQMTSSSHSDYFKSHNDNGTPDTASRRLTFVYYFQMLDTKGFTGGELTLDTSPPIMIQPNNNSIVWFPSHLMHEVHPVTSDGSFMDSRTTLNGWIRTT